ncbi:RrF2 family transcriptional regulator [Streptomyces sp. NPDC057136]|uniref:RrF2 family transcriptional regulator n=1 Tax=Streptomyces sp. NPDC057136 TaxID=3346029 RepID=UPI003634A248
MRISAKADYALRATAQLALDAAGGTPVKASRIAAEQDIPLKFLQGVLAELKRARIVRSTRGPEGGFLLGRPAEEITLADVYRAVDGPLINVRDARLTELQYAGPAEPLREVWMAARTSLRNVLEQVTLAEIASGGLPEAITLLADQYRNDVRIYQ